MDGCGYTRFDVKRAWWLASTRLLGYLSPAPRTGFVHADAWTIHRPSLELLLGQHPCWTQAAGERYPIHLADAETYAESATKTQSASAPPCLHRALFGTSRCKSAPRRTISSRVSASLGVDEELRTVALPLSPRRRMVGPMSLRQLDKTGMFFTAAAPGTDGVRSTRLRGQGP